MTAQLSETQMVRVTNTQLLINRQINLLSSNSKQVRSKALNSIQENLLDSEINDFLLKSSLLNVLLKSFADPVEKCRLISVQIVFKIILSDSNDKSYYLQFVIPCIADRIDKEDSEELRLVLISNLFLLISQTHDLSSPFIDQLSLIITSSLLDTFQEIKKEACKLVIALSHQAPRVFSLNVSLICTTLVSLFSHRHSSVRISAINAVGACIFVDAANLDTVVDGLWILVRDGVPSVRKALYSIILDWQLKLIDRYSLSFKFISLLIAGCSDELQDLRLSCRIGLTEVGKLYEIEWPDRVKDELDLVPLSGQSPGILFLI